MLLLIPAALVAWLTAADPVREPALLAELMRRVQRDQGARLALMHFDQRHQWSLKSEREKPPHLSARFRRLVEQAAAIDAENTAWLKQIVDKHGWPGKSLVGREGAHAAWLLVQHADRDRDFQRRCLELMRKLPAGEVEPKDIAYLTDRVAVGEGRKQTYGTQLVMKDGKLVPQTPIEDEANVDRRRAAVGLGTMKEYLEFMEKQMKEPEKGRQ